MASAADVNSASNLGGLANTGSGGGGSSSWWSENGVSVLGFGTQLVNGFLNFGSNIYATNHGQQTQQINPTTGMPYPVTNNAQQQQQQQGPNYLLWVIVVCAVVIFMFVLFLLLRSNKGGS